jgi:hypothetical protein
MGKAGVDLSDGHTEPVRRRGQFDSRPPDGICHCRSRVADAIDLLPIARPSFP